MRRFFKQGSTITQFFKQKNYYQFNQPSLYKEKISDFTNTMNIPLPDKLKIFRVIDLQGNLLSNDHFVAENTLNQIFDLMIRIEEMDLILYMSQRQGKISFYMTSFGETAVTVATAAALKDQDVIYTQYREQGTFMWRGMTIQEIVDQCMGNSNDSGKGRQMPMHFGSKQHNMPTVSSPLTTQVPQASGAGYGFRVGGEDRIAVAFFGEGATSEGDFHSAMNFATTLKSQTLFLCRNNHYAISTHSDEQFQGDTIASRGISYGMRSLKVDGNDALAVFIAVQHAREQIITHKAPFMIEFMTYRIGDHSTSDHSILYRNQEEIDSWKTNNNPITRLGLYLKKSGKRILNDEHDKEIKKQVREEVIQALKKGSQCKYPKISELFTDVYDIKTQNLIEQENELKSHLKKYGQHYDLDKFQQD